jgi:hypothetical protein
MESEPDLTLETDRLEQLLETPPPPQSVVVVEYRNRGVPTWIFFPLIVLVPLGALLVYDRTVTQRERAAAAQTRQSLESLAAQAGTSPAGQAANASAPNSAPAGTLYIVQSAESQANPASAGAAPATPAAPDSLKGTGPAAEASVTREGGPSASPPASAAGTARTENSVVSATDRPSSPLSDSPVGPPAILRPTVRSILPNPFADGTKPPQPPDPGAGPAPPPTANGEKSLPVAGQSEPAPRPATQKQATDTPQPATELASRDDRPAPETALPSKEESERQIRAEAAKLQADRLAQVNNRVATQHSHWMEEQIKFREELSEVLTTHRNQAGPEIDKLTKRYDGEIDQASFDRGYKAWFHSRGLTQSAKVKLIRALELPEAIALEFMCADLHRQIGKREGPRDANDVRVKAALRLLQYPFPETDKSASTGGAGRQTSPARAQ